MKTCLIVDDSRVVRKVAARIIKDMRFEVTEAGNGSCLAIETITSSTGYG